MTIDGAKLWTELQKTSWDVFEMVYFKPMFFPGGGLIQEHIDYNNAIIRAINEQLPENNYKFAEYRFINMSNFN